LRPIRAAVDAVFGGGIGGFGRRLALAWDGRMCSRRTEEGTRAAMGESERLREPWLIAAWPGMGSVALVAASYLVQHLRPRKVHELNPTEFFEVQSIEVHDGVATASPLPRGMFFEWRHPDGGRDLLIHLGEAQPASRGYILCREVVEYAASRGARRAFSFAAIATQLYPGTPPRAFAASNDLKALEECKTHGAEALKGGKIGGLNGLLLPAAAERAMPAVCLLGELPYFGVEVPNPGAAKAVLERFCALAGIELDFGPLEHQARALEQRLLQLLDQLEAGDQAEVSGVSEGEGEEEWNLRPEGLTAEQERPAPPPPDPVTLRKIEALFRKATQDRTKAVELKQELDRLGLFKQYEDRFLDLFHQAG
jgi:uncharacterized protein